MTLTENHIKTLIRAIDEFVSLHSDIIFPSLNHMSYKEKAAVKSKIFQYLVDHKLANNIRTAETFWKIYPNCPDKAILYLICGHYQPARYKSNWGTHHLPAEINLKVSFIINANKWYKHHPEIYYKPNMKCAEK